MKVRTDLDGETYMAGGFLRPPAPHRRVGGGKAGTPCCQARGEEGMLSIIKGNGVIGFVIGDQEAAVGGLP